jgi:hypothetical protein
MAGNSEEFTNTLKTVNAWLQEIVEEEIQLESTTQHKL